MTALAEASRRAVGTSLQDFYFAKHHLEKLLATKFSRPKNQRADDLTNVHQAVRPRELNPQKSLSERVKGLLH